jgi:hypothetical protein
MNKLIFSIITLIALSPNAWAGKEGGGKGMYCQGRNEILHWDYVRAESPEWKMNLVLEDGPNEYEIAKKMIQRIHELDPVREARYLADLASFESQVTDYPDWRAFMVEDSREFGVPDKCDLIVVIRQKKVLNRRERPYERNILAWNRMHRIQRAGVIVHEIVLKEYREVNETGAMIFSDLPSYYNGYIASQQFRDEGRLGYARTLGEVGFEYFMPIHPSNKIRSLEGSYYRLLPTAQGELLISLNNGAYSDDWKKIDAYTVVAGKYFFTFRKTYVNLVKTIKASEVGNTSITVTPDGRLSSISKFACVSDEPTPHSDCNKIVIQGKKTKVSPLDLSLYDSNKLKILRLNEDRRLLTTDRKIVEVKKYYKILLDEDGLLIKTIVP